MNPLTKRLTKRYIDSLAQGTYRELNQEQNERLVGLFLAQRTQFSVGDHVLLGILRQPRLTGEQLQSLATPPRWVNRPGAEVIQAFLEHPNLTDETLATLVSFLPVVPQGVSAFKARIFLPSMTWSPLSCFLLTSPGTGMLFSGSDGCLLLIPRPLRFSTR